MPMASIAISMPPLFFAAAAISFAMMISPFFPSDAITLCLPPLSIDALFLLLDMFPRRLPSLMIPRFLLITRAPPLLLMPCRHDAAFYALRDIALSGYFDACLQRAHLLFCLRARYALL